MLVKKKKIGKKMEERREISREGSERLENLLRDVLPPTFVFLRRKTGGKRIKSAKI